ncbi:predicted protein [Naegleria gruberi]|uniref:Predicted protein n=1 Tax=Naegleria gruberi TaxID=5762 RepID=D2VYV0_NAEGR|nr:uncharacterized protein NAEGRDRAFT_59621 [Naegleria gruberi]EFC38021.1 predicted protein [Naegleria gruberi]|eukprot:XP_002670765.1 predicted protein [Naegleria gruberi strain NEG-M]
MSNANSLLSTIILLIFLATLLQATNITFTCFGKTDQEPAVCSGNGLCQANNACSCNVGYFGSECEIMAPRYNISTIAGTGSAGYNGDGGLAIETMLSSPQGVAVSESGEVYLSDSTNNIIRKVYLNGTIQTIAGSRTQGYSGDNGPAVNCQFFSPQGLSLSPSNSDLYIADTFNNVVRRLDLNTGYIRPFVGDGGRGYTSPGDGNAFGWFNVIRGLCLSPNGELIFTDTENNMIRKVYANGLYDVSGRGQTNSYLGDGGLGINAWLGIPYQIAVNSDLDVFFVDSLYNVVRRIKQSSGIINAVIGTGSGFGGDGGQATSAQLSSPKGLVVSSSGEMFLADSGNNRIRKVFSNGIIVTIAGTSSVGFSGDGGLSTDAQLNNPVNLAIRQLRSLSEIYISDAGNHAIRKLTAFCEETHALIDGLCHVQCFGKTNQDFGVCSGRGNCTTHNQCSCNVDEGYYGENCEDFNCNGVNWRNASVCSGNGVCSSLENCTCSTGYYGTNCEFFDCFGVNSMDPSVCSAHGKCVTFNNCSCNTGYFGQSCQSFKCFGLESNDSLVCSSHGLCTDYNTCNCSNGYYGAACQLFNCYGTPQDNPSVCSGHGKCLQVDQCLCQDGYYGANCEQFNCSGKSSNDPTVCSARGICSSYNNCSCQLEGYYGATCEHYNCFDISKNAESVCSAHGICSSFNNCTCFIGYSGSDCSQYSCYGLSSLNPSTCSSHGICSSHNNCTCSKGYYGSKCESFDCLGISKNDSRVCSGHGFCSSFNNCTCLDGYYGNNCQNFTCFDVMQASPEVCSSIGICIDKNVCLCLNNTSGEKCQNRAVSPIVSLGMHSYNYFSGLMSFASIMIVFLWLTMIH